MLKRRAEWHMIGVKVAYIQASRIIFLLLFFAWINMINNYNN